MSDKEYKRRKMISQVMKKAWFLFKHGMHSWSTCLRAAWRTLRSLTRIYHSKARGTTYGNRQQILRRLARHPECDILLRFQRESTRK